MIWLPRGGVGHNNNRNPQDHSVVYEDRETGVIVDYDNIFDSCHSGVYLKFTTWATQTKHGGPDKMKLPRQVHTYIGVIVGYDDVFDSCHSCVAWKFTTCATQTKHIVLDEMTLPRQVHTHEWYN